MCVLQIPTRDDMKLPKSFKVMNESTVVTKESMQWQHEMIFRNQAK